MSNSTSCITHSITDDSGTSLLFRRCLEKDLHAPNESQGYSFHASVGIRYFSESQDRKHREQTPLLLYTFSCALFFTELTNVAHKNCTELPCSPQNSFTPWVRSAGGRFQNTLETHCWIAPGNSLLDLTQGQDTSFQEDVCKIHWDCATSDLPHIFFSCWSLCAQLSVLLVRRTTCSGQGGLLPGRTNRGRPRGRNEHRNFLT